jgi:hypothetical protein
MNPKQIETVYGTIQAFAKAILENPLACSVNSDVNLAEIVNETDLEKIGSSQLQVGFSVDNANSWSSDASIRLRIERGDYNGSAHEDGSIWTTYHATVTTDWNSCRDNTPTVAFNRAQLVYRVAQLGSELAEKFSGTAEVCVRTAEEQAKHVEEEKLQAEARKIKSACRIAADTVRRAMRVGNDRNVPAALLAGVPNGVYELEFSDYDGRVERKYTLIVQQPDSAGYGYSYLTRKV